MLVLGLDGLVVGLIKLDAFFVMRGMVYIWVREGALL